MSTDKDVLVKRCCDQCSPPTPTCRFCLLEEDTSTIHKNPLISPCDCKGSLKYVHLDCLTRWQDAVLQSALLHDIVPLSGEETVQQSAPTTREWPPSHYFSLMKVIQCPLCKSTYSHSQFHYSDSTTSTLMSMLLSPTLCTTSTVYWQLAYHIYSRFSVHYTKQLYRYFQYLYSINTTTPPINGRYLLYGFVYCLLYLVTIPSRLIPSIFSVTSRYQPSPSSPSPSLSVAVTSTSSTLSSTLTSLFRCPFTEKVSDSVLTSIEYFYPSLFPPSPNIAPFLSPPALQKGVFLVADPTLPIDSPYYRSVLLLYVHRSSGVNSDGTNTKIPESRGVFINKEDFTQPQASIMSPEVCCGYGGPVRSDLAVSVVLHNQVSLYHRNERSKKLQVSSMSSNCDNQGTPVLVTEQDQAYIA